MLGWAVGRSILFATISIGLLIRLNASIKLRKSSSLQVVGLSGLRAVFLIASKMWGRFMPSPLRRSSRGP